MTSTTTNLAVVSEATGGLLLPCPRCGSEESVVTLSLSDFDTCYCTDCENEFTLTEVQALLEKWAPILKWVQMAPRQ